MTFWERIQDRWLTWRTGKDKAQREWESWYETTVVWRASTINNMFMNFKHVIIVNPDKFMDPFEPFAWVPNKDASQYFWPKRSIEDTCVWRFERVNYDQWNGWVINGMFGEDKIFVATNNDADATMLALLYS